MSDFEMDRLIKKKVSASTLIETLIAMVIIMVVFAIAIRVFNNLMSSGVSLKKIQVQNQLNLFCKTVQSDGYLATTHTQLDGIDYDFESDTSAIIGLSKLKITAHQEGKQLGIVKCLFKEKEMDGEN